MFMHVLLVLPWKFFWRLVAVMFVLFSTPQGSQQSLSRVRWHMPNVLSATRLHLESCWQNSLMMSVWQFYLSVYYVRCVFWFHIFASWLPIHGISVHTQTKMKWRRIYTSSDENTPETLWLLRSGKSRIKWTAWNLQLGSFGVYHTTLWSWGWDILHFLFRSTHHQREAILGRA